MLEHGASFAPEGAKKFVGTGKNDRILVFFNFDTISRNFDSLTVFGNPTWNQDEDALDDEKQHELTHYEALGALYPSNMDDNNMATGQQQTPELSGGELPCSFAARMTQTTMQQFCIRQLNRLDRRTLEWQTWRSSGHSRNRPRVNNICIQEQQVILGKKYISPVTLTLNLDVPTIWTVEMPENTTLHRLS
jgi:hypothetical protein